MSEFQCAINTTPPPSPPAGVVSMYVKADGLWYYKDAAGVEKPVVEVSSVAGKTGAVTLAPADAGAEPSNSNIQAHIGSVANPHGVTKAQVGLSAVNNTADLVKPISIITQIALDAKLAITSMAQLIGNIQNPLVNIPFKRANDETALSGVQTFTRASTATYVDPLDGLVKTAAIDTPRFEKMSDGVVGILIEGASTNFCPRSDVFSGWVGSIQATANAGVAPDGTNTATRLTDPVSGGAGQHIIATLSPIGDITYSVWLKAETGSNSRLIIYNANEPITTFASATIDLAAGTMSATSGTGSIVQYANGWYRVSITGTSASPNSLIYIYPDTTASTTNSILAWGAQAENIPFASSYIPTTVTVVTRASDNLSLAASGNAMSTSDDATIIIDYDVNGFSGAQELFRGTGAGASSSSYDAYVSTAILARVNGNTIQTNISPLTVGRLAVVVSNNGISLSVYHNGSLIASLSNGTPSAQITMWTLGNYSNTSQYMFGHLRNFRVYDRALTALESSAA